MSSMEVLRVRKRPVEVEAMLFTGTVGSQALVCEWMGRYGQHPHGGGIENGWETLIIPTLEGDHKAVRGDFIIKGVADEFYPCNGHIFNATYEVVE